MEIRINAASYSDPRLDYIFEDVASMLWPDDWDKDNHDVTDLVKDAFVGQDLLNRVTFDSEAGMFYVEGKREDLETIKEYLLIAMVPATIASNR